MNKLEIAIVEREQTFAKFTESCDEAKNISDFDSEEDFLAQATLIDKSFKEYKVLTRDILDCRKNLINTAFCRFKYK